MKKNIKILFIFSIFLNLIACSAGRKAIWETEEKKVTVSDEGKAKALELLAKADEIYKQRDDIKKLEECIGIYEEALKLDPKNLNIYTNLSQAYFFIAYYHYHYDSTKDKEYLDNLNKGVNVAERGLVEVDPKFKAELKAGKKMKDVIEMLDKKGVPLMFWYGTNLGLWSKKKGFTTMLYYKDTIFKMMQHVLKLDPDYSYGGPHRYFGAYYAIAPAFAGGDLKKSEEHFNWVIKKYPKMVATQRLKAQYLSVKKQDEDEYEDLLNSVLDTKPESFPEFSPEIKAEHKRANKLLDDFDEYF